MSRHNLSKLVKGVTFCHISLALVPFLVAFETQAHKVIKIKADVVVCDIARCQLNDVMHFLRSFAAILTAVSVPAQCVLTLLSP